MSGEAYKKLVAAVEASTSGVKAVDDIRVGSIILAGLIVKGPSGKLDPELLMTVCQITALAMRFSQFTKNHDGSPKDDEVLAIMRETLIGLCDRLVERMDAEL